MNEAVIALISAIVGALVGSIFTYCGSIKVLMKERRSSSYAELMTALQQVFAVQAPIKEHLKEIEKGLNEAYARLLIIGEDKYIEEFHHILDIENLEEKAKALKRFAISLRKEFYPNTSIKASNLKKIELKVPA